eukprot:1608735-Rhodomonas_salina.3
MNLRRSLRSILTSMRTKCPYSSKPIIPLNTAIICITPCHQRAWDQLKAHAKHRAAVAQRRTMHAPRGHRRDRHPHRAQHPHRQHHRHQHHHPPPPQHQQQHRHPPPSSDHPHSTHSRVGTWRIQRNFSTTGILSLGLPKSPGGGAQMPSRFSRL